MMVTSNDTVISALNNERLQSLERARCHGPGRPKTNDPKPCLEVRLRLQGENSIKKVAIHVLA